MTRSMWLPALSKKFYNSKEELGKDVTAMQRLKDAAEKAKKELSTTMTTNVNLPFITAVCPSAAVEKI